MAHPNGGTGCPRVKSNSRLWPPEPEMGGGGIIQKEHVYQECQQSPGAGLIKLTDNITTSKVVIDDYNMDLFGLGDPLILPIYDPSLLDDHLDIPQANTGHSDLYLQLCKTDWDAVQLHERVLAQGYPKAWRARIQVKSGWNIELMSLFLHGYHDVEVVQWLKFG